MIRIPAGPAGVTPEWLTEVLRADGRLSAAGRVVACPSRPIGNGLVGESLRFTLAYAGESGDAPGSIVCKFPAADPAYRKVGVDEMIYFREVRFYREVAATVGIRAPRPYLAIDDPSGAFVLVLEDLGPAEIGDQIAGTSVERAEIVVDAAAALHAPRWGDPELDRASWNLRVPYGKRIGAIYPELFRRYRELFAHANTEEELAIGDRLAPVLGEWFAAQPRPWTVTHGDFRLDNMLFEILGGREPFAALDWQTLAPGPGTSDVAYFLGGCLSIEDRRRSEEDLLRLYHERLRERGVRDYPLERFREDARHGAFMGYYVCSYAAVLVPRTERGDRMFATWLSRCARQILDHDAIERLPA